MIFDAPLRPLLERVVLKINVKKNCDMMGEMDVTFVFGTLKLFKSVYKIKTPNLLLTSVMDLLRL